MNEPSAWSAYRPTADDPWDLGKVAHLHRRAGFGATRVELTRDLKAGPEASADRLFQPPEMSPEEVRQLENLGRSALASRDIQRLKAWWLYRILSGSDVLREKLALFWHGHFATSNRKVESLPMMLAQNELLRRRALGPFSELLAAVASDQAMLVWLDGAGSKKEKPNENFGREFLELFTLGIGNYTERDVREAARAFTGWAIERGDGGAAQSGTMQSKLALTDRGPKGGEGRFSESRHDAGEKTFLKQTGKWKSDDVIRIALEQPACAEFLCRKLYRYFVREDREPSAELLKPLAAELREHDYSVGHVVGVILRSRHFYDPAVRRQRIKSPVEWSLGLLRALEVPRADVRLLALAAACDRQGQELFEPPSVKGWDGGKAWLNSLTLLQRGNWGNDVVWGNADFDLQPYDPLVWTKRHDIDPKNAAESFLDLLLQGDRADKARELIVRAGRSGSSEALRKALQLILHCPESQLA
jgi:uncharacterized protein (DUF1800 family)